MNREELLAKCPEFRAITESYLSSEVEITGYTRDYVFEKDVAPALDEVLALLEMPPMLDETTAAQLRSFLEKLEGGLQFRSDWVSCLEHATHYVVDK